MTFEVLSYVETLRVQREQLARQLAEDYKTKTLQQIATERGITRERVRQILFTIGVSRKDGWRYKLSRSRCAEREARLVTRRETLCQKYYGCTWNQYVEITGHTRLYMSLGRHQQHGRNIYTLYWTHRVNAKKNGIGFDFTLPEYAEMVRPHIDHIGRGQLNLARKDKTKSFSKDNCEIITQAENSRRTRGFEKQDQRTENMKTALRMHAAGIALEQIGKTLGVSMYTVRSYLYRAKNMADHESR